MVNGLIKSMWSDRVNQLIKDIPGPFDNLRNEENPDVIFQSLKIHLLNPQYWEKITTLFSPIVLHLVSELILQSISSEANPIEILNLLSNLISSFSSIEPLIHFYFSYHPAEKSEHISEIDYLRSLYRIRRILGKSLELKLSHFIKLTELQSSGLIHLNEDAWFYLSSLISCIKNMTEDETLSFISTNCSSDRATRLFLEETNFHQHTNNLQLENYGPMSYNCRFATSIHGIPFLRSLSSSDYETEIPSSPFARSLALAMLTHKPVLVTGPPGSGKTTLIKQFAAIAGTEIASLHLGSAVDAKSLLGGYICGEIPGEFRWLDGALTAAVRANERWIVLEQIEEASPEVMALIWPLLSERRLFVPGRSETIKAGYNIRLFATSVQPLNMSLWTKIEVDFLNEDELVKAIEKTHPNLVSLINKLLPSWECCKLSYHELFRCLERLEVFQINKAVSHDTYLSLYQTVVDTFTSHLANFQARLERAIEIAKIWDLSRIDAEAYLINEKPALHLNPIFKIGNIQLPYLDNPKKVDDFAETFTSLHHMESVARALLMAEPILLVGETGTGKTTLIQFIALSIGADLTVINMHHQSDTLDILGGFKPVDLFKLLAPILDSFQKTFKKTFSQKKNAEMLMKIETLFGEKRWEDFLTLIRKISSKALKEKTDLAPEILSEWGYLKNAAAGFLSRTDFLQRDFAFGFVEGPLTKAYRDGQWILLDEVNLAPPETLLALAPIIDGQLELPNGEIIKKHPNFRLISCMNPATDVGKVNLPETLKHKFVSIFTDETSSENDIKLILTKRKVNQNFHQVIYDFYTQARQMSKTILVDGGGQRVIYSLRALTRAMLYMNKAEPFFGPFRACYDALILSFISPLSIESKDRLIAVLNSMITPNGFPTKTVKKKTPAQPIATTQFKNAGDYVEVEGFYIPKGPLPILRRDDFILTDTARKYLKLLAQAVFLKTSPILLQGPTSSGKTTIVKYLADITGHKFVRINNHEHTDMSEYIGAYAPSSSGKFEFVDGALVTAIDEGSWVVLDELNLAPSDVLEALNRLLDQNNQLYVAETQKVHDPKPSFMLFATQNPPGAYGGRKQLSRAFRGRFIEIHVDEIPPKELATIIVERTHMAPEFAKSMVEVFNSLRRQRQFSHVFAGKHAFLTVRDLLRWAFRAPDTWASVANEGFCLLGERLRTQEERDIVIKTIYEKTKTKEEIQVPNEFEPQDISDEMNIVWTSGMVRSVNLLLKCIQNKEPALLVGETGTGKTTAVQVVAYLLNRRLRILNCHQHTEASDFIGAMRPTRNSDSDSLFEWVDGSLVDAMKEGDIFLMDEISLAQDSALERLNSVLEPERKLAIAEKPEYDVIEAHPNFVFIGTMNPGGDYGKRELSASLRNRFTEIWVPSIDRDEDLIEILQANSTQQETQSNANLFLEFVRYFTNLSKTYVNISLRDVLQWIRFVDLRVSRGNDFLNSYIQGCYMVFIDCLPPNLRSVCIDFLKKQLQQESIHAFSHEVQYTDTSMLIGEFELPKGPYYQSEIEMDANFVFDAPTTSQNLLRVGRALQMPLPILIEGPPGVGKTSLVMSLGKRLGFNVVRINLSEHTEMLDLVGSELPVENGESGNFAWRDGAFLSALKNGDWVILDELNLASQSVLEGLNSCLDHRAALFVPELNMEFKCHPEFRIFGCQNPAGAGHGRKSLPRSFLNRFTRVYVDELSANDFQFIIAHSYTDIDLELRKKMISFIAKLNEMKLKNDFEFNLRDVFRLCELIIAGITPQKALTLLFLQRLRTTRDREEVCNMLFALFGNFDMNPKPFLISSKEFRIGDLRIDRAMSSYAPTDLIIHPSIIPHLEAILTCAYMKWPGLVVGGTATAKSSLIRLAAHISGKKLVEFSMNNSVDTTELLGGFEQMDNHRCFEQLREKIKPSDAQSLLQLENIDTLEDLIELIDQNREQLPADIISEASQLFNRKKNSDPGRFEWVDGLLLRAMRNGWWIIIDNANLCPPAVLDRLNPLCEPGGVLTLNERGIVDDDIETIVPHEDFRLFMTVDPRYGEISRAMRNRSIEIYLPSFYERMKDEQSAKLLEEECKDLCGDQGEEFYQLMNECKSEENSLMKLSAWNMMAYRNFRRQTSVAQLGEDQVHFNIVECQLTNQQSKMTRSNSSYIAFHESEDEERNAIEQKNILSPFSFLPMTNSALLTVLYDAIYLFNKEPKSAAIRFFLGGSRSIDYTSRLTIAEQWPPVLKAMRELETSELLQFSEDLPIDPLLWPKPQENLAFSAHYLLLQLDLEPPDINDIESIDLRLNLSSLIPQFYSTLLDQIKFSIQTNSVSYETLLIVKAINFFNSRKSDSLSLFKFLSSMLKKSCIEADISPIVALMSPNKSLEAQKYRKRLGEPFAFKFENTYILWDKITEHWKSLFVQSPMSFMSQSKQIISMLETLIVSQTVTNQISKLFHDLSEIQLKTDVSISFIDRVEVDEFQFKEEYKIVNLSTPYPFEIFQDLSIRAFIYSIIFNLSKGENIQIPPDFLIPLDIVALVQSYNTTKNLNDLLFALNELIHHIHKEIAYAPSLKTINSILHRKATLLQSAHMAKSRVDLYHLLTSIPAIDLKRVKESISNVFNSECEKLEIIKIDPSRFKETFLQFAKAKWERISAISEMDNSYYHMVISKMSDQLLQELSEDVAVLKEINYSRLGTENCSLVNSYQNETNIVTQLHDRSINKMKYRGDNPNQFSKLRSIVNRMTVSETQEFAESMDESSTVILHEFPLYRDITIPIVTAMRQYSFAIQYNEPIDFEFFPFPFTANSILEALFSSPATVNWSLSFSLIGRTSLIHPPIAGFQIPRTNPEFHTIQEEEKVAQQIEELFSKRKKNELGVYANHFVESMLNPDGISTEKLLKMAYKQLQKFDIEQPLSINTDLQFLPLLFHALTTRYKGAVSSKSVNIYQKSSVEHIDELLRIVRTVLKDVNSLWERYPNHDTLRQIAKAADSILGQEIDAPLINFLDGLENLMDIIRDWQHKDRDFGNIIPSMVKLADKLLEMKLNSYKNIFETRQEVLKDNTGKDFYLLFCQLNASTIDSIPNLFESVISFIELSPIGLLEYNLRVVEAFAVYSLRFDEIGHAIFSLLMNVVYKYRRYLPNINRFMKSELADLDKKMRDFSALQHWDNNSDKKHFLKTDRVQIQLNKYCQQRLAVLQLQFKQMIDQFATQISKEETIPHQTQKGIPEFTEKVDEILNTEISLRNRLFETRRYINTEMDITSSQNQTRYNYSVSPIHFFSNKPLYGKEFDRHNELYGELLILMEQIKSASYHPHDDVRDEAQDIFGIAENLIIYINHKRDELFVEPYVYRDDVKFVINQLTHVLRSFSELAKSEGTEEKTKFSNDIMAVTNYIERLCEKFSVRVDDVIEELQKVKSILSNNYAHYSMDLFIDRTISILRSVTNPTIPQHTIQQDIYIRMSEENLSLMRFAVAAFRIFASTLKEGYGEKKDGEDDDKPQETEGKDGTGLGEGVGDEDITNEIEDEDQLVGDNVNTNNDQQNENDVERENGFEVEDEMNGAADVSAHDEEEDQPDEMGDADTDEAMRSREAEDDSKEADKEADVQEEKNTETKQKDEEDEEANSAPENEENEIEEKPKEMESDDNEDESQFESEAGQFTDNPEEMKIDEDSDHLLNNIDENAEEEEVSEGAQEDENYVDEKPPDIEDEPDEYLGLTHPDKENDEGEEDMCDNKDIKGEGKSKDIGEGQDGEADENQNEENRTTNEDDEEKKQEEEIKRIEKELKIVQKNILEGDDLKEGGEGGERDDEADEGIILPSMNPEDHDALQKEEEDQPDKEGPVEEGNEGELQNEFDTLSQIEHDNEDEDDGITHIKFPDPSQGLEDTLNIDQCVVIVNKHEITSEGRAKWESLVDATRENAADLCEQLRLVLEATVAAKMRGDFRTGKRLNMRKIIPFIASGFRKDKIWMRRVQPDQRNYQVYLAVDNSKSMKDNTSDMALHSISLITQALTLLGIGELCVAKFGQDTEIVHPFGQTWNDDSGASLIDSFRFDEEKTNYDNLLFYSLQYLQSVRKTDAMQLFFIISDAVNLGNRDLIKQLVLQAQLKNLLVVFIIIDSQDKSKRPSVLDTRCLINNTVSYFLDEFPFPFYILINDPKKLPERLADALRQWFDLANNNQ